MPGFQLNSKTIFLTYPQCPITKTELLEHLKILLGAKEEEDYIVVAQEQHADGSPHLHCFLRMNNAVRTRNPALFDFRDYHSNIQSARDPDAVRNYVLKEGSVVEFGTYKAKSMTWRDLLTLPTRAQATEALMREKPRDYILSLERIEYYLNKRYAPDLRPYEPRDWDTFTTPIELQEWIDQMDVTG